MNVFRSIIVVTAFAFFCGCGQAPGTNNAQDSNPTPGGFSPSPPAPVDLMAQGRKLYADNCAACHKQDGKGGKVTIEGKTINPDDRTSEKIKNFTDEKIYGYIFKGIEDEGMPAFKDKLSEAEIREVVKFLRAEIQKMHPPMVQKPVSQ